MLDMFFSILGGFISLLKYPLYFVVGIFCLFMFLCSIFVVIRLAQGKRFKKGEHKRVKRPGILKRLFVDLPRQYVDDIFERDPEFFRYQGMIIFEGRQGAGKSIAMIEQANRMLEEYPKAICTSNMNYKYQNKALKDWRMLLSYTNDIRGVVVIMDELQNWFSSNDSKNFPPEMLSVITQNRKNRRVILGTSQVFSMLAKAIRTQTTEVRRCTTLLGCLTLVRRLEPILDSEGNVVEWKKRGFYFFVHDKKLRESYDTWKVIERFKNVGFQKREITPEVTSNTYILQETRKKGKP